MNAPFSTSSAKGDANRARLFLPFYSSRRVIRFFRSRRREPRWAKHGLPAKLFVLLRGLKRHCRTSLRSRGLRLPQHVIACQGSQKLHQIVDLDIAQLKRLHAFV